MLPPTKSKMLWSLLYVSATPLNQSEVRRYSCYTLSSNHKLCHIHDVTFQLLSCLVSVLALSLYYPMYVYCHMLVPSRTKGLDSPLPLLATWHRQQCCVPATGNFATSFPRRVIIPCFVTLTRYVTQKINITLVHSCNYFVIITLQFQFQARARAAPRWPWSQTHSSGSATRLSLQKNIFGLL